jgi:hypothetical protein
MKKPSLSLLRGFAYVRVGFTLALRPHDPKRPPLQMSHVRRLIPVSDALPKIRKDSISSRYDRSGIKAGRVCLAITQSFPKSDKQEL